MDLPMVTAPPWVSGVRSPQWRSATAGCDRRTLLSNPKLLVMDEATSAP